MQGSWNHRVSMICFAFCHVSCLRLMSVVDRSPPLSPWPCGLRIVQGLVQALFLQGEKSAALVGCPTVSSQGKPSTASKNGFPKGKKLATELAKDTALVVLMKSAVRMVSTFSQDLGLGLHQFCCHVLTWCRWGSTGPMVSFYLSPWSNGFFWLIRCKPEIKKNQTRNKKKPNKPEIKNASNNWTGRRCCSYAANRVHHFQSG